MTFASKILAAVKKLAPQGKRIKVLGHSRGGNLGQLAAIHLATSGFGGRFDWMGFGIARTGNKVFSDLFARLIPNALRVVHKRDIVSRLPPMLLDFHHTRREVWFEEDNKYKLCSNTNGEDPTCSRSINVPWIFDHFYYLGMDKRSGKPHGCF